MKKLSTSKQYDRANKFITNDLGNSLKMRVKKKDLGIIMKIILSLQTPCLHSENCWIMSSLYF